MLKYSTFTSLSQSRSADKTAWRKLITRSSGINHESLLSFTQTRRKIKILLCVNQQPKWDLNIDRKLIFYVDIFLRLKSYLNLLAARSAPLAQRPLRNFLRFIHALGREIIHSRVRRHENETQKPIHVSGDSVSGLWLRVSDCTTTNLHFLLALLWREVISLYAANNKSARRRERASQKRRE